MEEEECFTLMDQAVETLKLKLSDKKVSELELPAVRIAIHQISVFLSQSSRERSEILELESPAPSQSHHSKLLRLSITKTVRKELQTRGRQVPEMELSSLVEAEYQRVVHNIPHRNPRLLAPAP